MQTTLQRTPLKYFFVICMLRGTRIMIDAIALCQNSDSTFPGLEQ